MRRVVIPALICWLGAVAFWVGQGPDEDRNHHADVAIVLGAAVFGDTPSPVFEERIAHGVHLLEGGRVKYLLFTGGKSDGDSLAESEAARALALAQGVPEDAVLTESRSATTYQNLVEAQKVMAKAELQTAIIVSDPLHLRRALEMADDLGLSAKASATPTTRYRSFSTKAPFLLREMYFMQHYWIFGA